MLVRNFDVEVVERHSPRSFRETKELASADRFAIAWRGKYFIRFILGEMEAVYAFWAEGYYSPFYPPRMFKTREAAEQYVEEHLSAKKCWGEHWSHEDEIEIVALEEFTNERRAQARRQA